MQSWSWKDTTYTGCAPEHPDSKSPWCYIKGGLECGASVKESKVRPGQFWKHCSMTGSPAVTKPIVPGGVKPITPMKPMIGGDCQCLSSWSWKETTYTGCAPEHPDSK